MISWLLASMIIIMFRRVRSGMRELLLHRQQWPAAVIQIFVALLVGEPWET